MTNEETNALPMPKVQISFGNLEKATHETVEILVEENITGKMSAYLRKIYSHHQDAEVIIDISLSKNENDDTFNGTFRMSYPQMKEPLNYSRERFKDLIQLIDHAFQHFKEYLASQK